MNWDIWQKIIYDRKKKIQEEERQQLLIRHAGFLKELGYMTEDNIWSKKQKL